MADELMTIGERVEHLTGARKIKSAGALARLVEAEGYPVSRQTIAALMRGGVDTPRAGLIAALDKVLHTTEEYLLYGPREGDDPFVAELSGLAPDLTQHQRDQLLFLATDMAKETRERRAFEKRQREVTPDELNLLEMLRQSPPGTLDALLSQVRETSKL